MSDRPVDYEWLGRLDSCKHHCERVMGKVMMAKDASHATNTTRQVKQQIINEILALLERAERDVKYGGDQW